MSSKKRDHLWAELSEAVRGAQAAVDLVDQALADLLGVNRTDAHCLDLLLQEPEGVAPSVLGKTLGLTSGSVTAMLDRLEKLGYLTRSPHASDRRKVVVKASPSLAEQAYAAMRPLMEESAQEFAHYSDAELELIIDFHRRNRRLQERQVERLRRTPSA